MPFEGWYPMIIDFGLSRAWIPSTTPGGAAVAPLPSLKPVSEIVDVENAESNEGPTRVARRR